MKMKTGTKQKIVIVFFAVLSLAIGAWFGSYVTASMKDREIEEILSINETLHEEIASTKTRTTSLSRSLKDLICHKGGDCSCSRGSRKSVL